MDRLDWPSLALGLAVPPLLWAARKALSSYRNSPRPNRAPVEGGLKVVITGSSRGLGLALANEFLSLGDDVVVTSRTSSACEAAAAQLRERHPSRKVLPFAADVSSAKEAEALAQFAASQLGRIDIWVNNAGLSQGDKAAVADADPEVISSIVGTNLLGSMYGSAAAIRVMRQQPEGGKVFLIDGTGAWGNATPGNAAYGATKRALTQLLGSLVAELKGLQVGVHIASPGMVATDLLLSGIREPRSIRIINALAEDAAVVAAWMVPRLRGVTGTGRYFCFLTPGGAIWRFLTAHRRRNRFLQEVPKKSA